MIVVSYIVPVCRMISLIVQEKEYKIKEIMMIMGLSNKAYWLSVITYYFSLYTVVAAVAGLLAPVTFRFSDPGLIFLLFWVYGISCMSYSILVSVFFSKTRSAVVLGLMIYFVSYFISFAANEVDVSYTNKTLGSLLPNLAISLACDVLSRFEKGQAGVQNDNLNTKIVNYSFGTGLGFLFLDSLIMLLLAVYFEQVWPTEWGVKRPWYFLFQKNF